MPTYRDEAVVLRTHKLGEADRIITLLTREHGKVRAVARGVRRTSSKLGARVEPFSHVDVQLAVGRNLDVVAQAETLHPYGEAMITEYPRYTAGTVMLETADRVVVEEREPALQQFRLLLGGLHVLASATSDGYRPATMILDSYLLRALATAGYAPSLSDCARCGRPGPHQAFAPTAGGVVCPSCRPPGSALPQCGTLTYLQHLLSGDWVATRDVTPGERREASGLVSSFVQWHLDRGLRTLKYLDRAETTPPDG